jgi:hypothetical protein
LGSSRASRVRVSEGKPLRGEGIALINPTAGATFL